MFNQIEKWEKRNKEIVKNIDEFNKEFIRDHKQEFIENPFEAHKKMLRTSAVLFRNEIENQIDCLVNLGRVV